MDEIIRTNENTVLEFYEQWKEEVDSKLKNLNDEKIKLKNQLSIIFYKNRFLENEPKLRELFKEEIKKNTQLRETIEENIKKINAEIEKYNKLSSRLDCEINF